MRILAVAVVTAGIIILGLSFRPAPHATPAAPEQTRTQMDPHALQSTGDVKSLPSQHFAEPY